MMRRNARWIRLTALVVASGVMLATVAQALREHSLEPIWTLGWLPAVLAATITWPRRGTVCLPRAGRRRRS